MIFKDIYNEKIIPDRDGFFHIMNNIGSITIILLLVYFFYSMIILSNNKNKTILIIILVLIFIILYIDTKLYSNKSFSKIKIDLDKIKCDLNTGDIVMFRCYYNSKLNDVLLYKCLLPIIQQTFFTHIAMVYKDKNGKINLLEFNSDDFYCNFTNKIKNGSMIFNIDERLKNLKNYRVHIVKNNLHKFIDIEKFNQSINKYKDHVFLQDGIYCVNYIMRLLEENNLYKVNNSLIPSLPIDILNKNNYNCDIIFEEPICVLDID